MIFYEVANKKVPEDIPQGFYFNTLSKFSVQQKSDFYF